MAEIYTDYKMQFTKLVPLSTTKLEITQCHKNGRFNQP